MSAQKPMDRTNPALVAHIGLEAAWMLRDQGLHEEAHSLEKVSRDMQKTAGPLPPDAVIPPAIHADLLAEVIIMAKRVAREERLRADTGETIH